MPDARDNRFPAPDRLLRASARRNAAVGAAIAGLLPAMLAGFGADAGPIALTAAVLFALAAVVAWPFLREHAPHTRFGLANRLTLLRGTMTAVLGATLIAPGDWVPASLATPGWPVTGLALACLALDGADGWAARRFGPASVFGARIDRELDALFTLVLAGLIWRAGLADAWILLAGAWRYLHFGLARIPTFQVRLPPSTRRRTVCALAQAALIAAIVPALPAAASAALAAASVVALSASFLIDLAWAWRRRQDLPEAPYG